MTLNRRWCKGARGRPPSPGVRGVPGKAEPGQRFSGTTAAKVFPKPPNTTPTLKSNAQTLQTKPGYQSANVEAATHRP
jgi:hypothetical protein